MTGAGRSVKGGLSDSTGKDKAGEAASDLNSADSSKEHRRS
jgi:hypothetical protein